MEIEYDKNGFYEDLLTEQDEALIEAEKKIKWIARWAGEYKAKEAREWLEKYGYHNNDKCSSRLNK